jgi:hypothetical protein
LDVVDKPFHLRAEVEFAVVMSEEQGPCTDMIPRQHDIFVLFHNGAGEAAV